ncbi:MAG: N-acetylneuraminate synthase [Bacteroidales bacterium]|nr:N-acetylneuraminate synthase [Bacteroidales bacterium]
MDRVLIIAEAGVNHNGSYDRAIKMIDTANVCGVDYIKFQTFKAQNIVNRYAPQAEYQKKNLASYNDGDDSQLNMLKSLELSFQDFVSLNDYCKKSGIKFLSTPFDLDSVDFLASIGMDYMKIPSGEITNLPYLRKIANLHVPVIMSTGMSTLGEVEQAVDVLYKGGLSTQDITLLHCNTEYPTPYSDVNLLAMETLKKAFGTKIGYSDHTKGIEVALAAVSLGASVIEKHFTLDKTLPGPDHVASLDPIELKAMVDSIRHIEEAIGHTEKRVTDSERKNIAVARKSIVAARAINEGEIFSEDNITVKRPGTGISPMLYDEVLGKVAKRTYGADELIEL